MEDSRGQFISHTRGEAAPSPQMGKQEHRGTHEHSCGDKSSEPGHRKIPYPKRPGNHKGQQQHRAKGYENASRVGKQQAKGEENCEDPPGFRANETVRHRHQNKD